MEGFRASKRAPYPYSSRPFHCKVPICNCLLWSDQNGEARLVVKQPPGLEDFKSQRAEKPKAVFQVSECQARGLSVFRRAPRLRTGAEITGIARAIHLPNATRDRGGPYSTP